MITSKAYAKCWEIKKEWNFWKTLCTRNEDKNWYQIKYCKT